MIQYRTGLVAIIAVVATLLPHASFASDLPETRTFPIDQVTIGRGITVGSKAAGVVLAILPNALSAPTTITLGFDEMNPGNTKLGFTPPLWSIVISMDPPVEILKPLPLIFSIDEPEEHPFIHRWEGGRERWEYISTSVSWSHQEVRTTIASAGAYAVLYDQSHHIYGRATWYPDRLSKDTAIAAASNEYPIGTKLKVTNVETQESVIVPIHSVGPFMKGRILDLTKSAFSKIGFPRKQGVLSVLVEPVGSRPAFELVPRKKR